MNQEVIIPDDCVLISARRDSEVFKFLSRHGIQAERNTRFWNKTIWRFPNPCDRTLFLLKWVK